MRWNNLISELEMDTKTFGSRVLDIKGHCKVRCSPRLSLHYSMSSWEEAV